MKYTPRPWKLETAQGGPNNGWCISAEKSEYGEQYVVLAQRGPIEGKEFAGNAKLMAAAPEMLELLDDACFELNIICDALQPNQGLGHAEAIRNRIDAFLQRITGKEITS